MFGKDKSKVQPVNNDMELLMQAMDQVINGQYDDIDVTNFANPAFGQKFNELLHGFKRSNNNFVMRLNEAMESIGDNSYVKNTMDQVQSQTESIAVMKDASQNLEASINNISKGMAHISENTHEMLSIMQDSTNNMNESIKAVNESSEQISDINAQVQKFHDKIKKIGEIVDIVKKISSQSNLLALNASIEAARAGEAGKGFAVVADQVRQLSSNTSESAEDIVRYVAELTNDIRDLAQFMNDTTTKLEQGNTKVQYSLTNIEQMSDRMIGIRDMVDNIFTDIDVQSNVTKDFTKQVSSISQSYEELSKDCVEQGQHEYRCGRFIDTVRSDMARGFAEVTVQDWMKIYEMDHFILMWRVYNNVVGFEQLKLTQLNNPETCKLGKWIAAQTDSQIKGSSEFAALKSAHYEVHRWATESWKAKDNRDEALALEYFQKTYDAFYVYKDAIKKMKERLKQLGYKEETQIIVFRK